jgi:hypothetical protein
VKSLAVQTAKATEDIANHILGVQDSTAGARGLDGGIERQKISLPGDIADQFDDIADLLRARRKPGNFGVGFAGFRRRHADDVAGVAELTADFGDRMGQFVGRDRRCFHVGGGLVKSLHGAFRALRGAAGRAEQGARGGAHRRRAIADAVQKRFHLWPERDDGAVDGGSALLLAENGGALQFGVALLGDVIMGRKPAAARKRFVLGQNDASIARFYVESGALAFGHVVDDMLAISIDVAGKQTGIPAVPHQLMHRAAGPYHLRRQPVHIDVALIAQHDAALRVEHAQALRHIIEGVGQPAVPPVQAALQQNCAGQSGHAQ